MNLRPALLALALAASGLAMAEPAAPARLLRLDLIHGMVRFQPAGSDQATGLPDRPLVAGDRLDTGAAGRAELTLDSTAIRLDARTRFAVVDLDGAGARISLEQGTASVIVRELYEGEALDIATPQTQVTLLAPGEYRIDVTEDGATDLSVRRGVAEATSAGGPVRIADEQRALIASADAYASLIAPRPADAFDDWVLDREVQLAEAAPPAEYDGEAQAAALNDYGEWVDEPRYGRVWIPGYAYGGYDPFRTGYWQSVGFGYSWVEPLPWAYYTRYGYGRWTWLHDRNRWCWVPRHRDRRPPQVAHDPRPYGFPRGNRRNDDDRRDRPRGTDVDRTPAPRAIEGDWVPSYRVGKAPSKVTLRRDTATPVPVDRAAPRTPVVRSAPQPSQPSQARSSARTESPSTFKSSKSMFAPRQVP